MVLKKIFLFKSPIRVDTKLCQLAVHCPQDGSNIVVLSVIDNLVKGAAGQAIQNMNIMHNLPQTMWLTSVGLLP
jgi:N-acetyl-gamma-glutamyl-phosphate reductase